VKLTRKVVKWALVILLAPAAGYLGLMLTFTRPMTGMEVLVPVSSGSTNACLVHALRTVVGPDHVWSDQDVTTVQHPSCFVSGRGGAGLTYALIVRDGQRYLSISADWRSIDRVSSECARATGVEIRRAVEAFATECDPGLVGRWDSHCEVSGAHASENFCPDPQTVKVSDGGR
jgi:hypothetical protein